MKLISDGRYISVPSDKLKSRVGLLNYKQVVGSKVVKVEDCLINELSLKELIEEPFEIVRSSYYYDFSRDLDYNKLADLAKSLRDYQVRDVEKMAIVGNVLNRNPMGTGKTVEAVALMKVIGVQSAIIVTPKSVVNQWKKTIEEWYPEVADRVEINSVRQKKNKILIYNYERLSRNTKLLESICSLGKWDIHICDEAHRIKNRDSKRTIAIKSIPSKRRVALTGTPWVNKPDDLWSILEWLDAKYSGISYWNFAYYFCNIKQDFWGQKIEGLTKSTRRVELLKQLLNIVSVWNKVSTEKSKEVVTVRLEMDKNQSSLFKAAKQLVLDELPEKLTIANGAVLTTRLQQVSSWPGLFNDTEKKRNYGQGIKFEWIQDLVEDNPAEKFVIFTRFATTAKALKKYLKTNSVLYIGEMNAKEREYSKELFISNQVVRVIIGTIGAMGEGVDGLQYASRTAIFIDRDWSPSVMEQCEDRLNRFGQENLVMCYYLECENSFDQYVGKINLSKAEDIRAVLEGEE